MKTQVKVEPKCLSAIWPNQMIWCCRQVRDCHNDFEMFTLAEQDWGPHNKENIHLVWVWLLTSSCWIWLWNNSFIDDVSWYKKSTLDTLQLSTDFIVTLTVYKKILTMSIFCRLSFSFFQEKIAQLKNYQNCLSVVQSKEKQVTHCSKVRIPPPKKICYHHQLKC